MLSGPGADGVRESISPPIRTISSAGFAPDAEFSVLLRDTITPSADRKTKLMENADRALERAERVFTQKDDRHEKGSAMGLIKADAVLTQEKTARLRALREARDASGVEAPPAKAKPAARRKAVKRGRT